MTADEVKILHAGERLGKQSGLFDDIMRGTMTVKSFQKPSKSLRSILPSLNVGLQGESGVPAATLPDLCRIVAKAYRQAAHN